MALPSSPAAVAYLEKQLFGVWKIESLYTETKADEWQESYGARPNGYGVLTRERRLMVIITAPDRKAPIMDADRSTAFLSMIAYRDPYRVEDGRFTTRVDTSWNEAWIGTEQVRFAKSEGDYDSHKRVAAGPQCTGKPGGTLRGCLEQSEGCLAALT
jgi:hypothetical protein